MDEERPTLDYFPPRDEEKPALPWRTPIPKQAWLSLWLMIAALIAVLIVGLLEAFKYRNERLTVIVCLLISVLFVAAIGNLSWVFRHYKK